MALLEDRTAVFIVRVWCERGDDDGSICEWRGSVEHVQSGQRAFFRNLETMCDYMKPHLIGIGIDVQQGFWERIASVIDGATPASEDAPVSLTVPIAVNPREPAAPGRARNRR